MRPLSSFNFKSSNVVQIINLSQNCLMKVESLLLAGFASGVSIA